MYVHTHLILLFVISFVYRPVRVNYKSNDTCNEYKRAHAYYVSEVVFLKTNVDLGEMSTVAYPETCKVEGLQWDGGRGQVRGPLGLNK